MKHIHKLWQAAVAVIFFVLMVGSAYVLLGVQDLEAVVAGAGIWAPLLLIALKAATIIISPLGGTPIYFAVPKLFGFWTGFVYLSIADIIGYATVFWISRLYGRRVMNWMLSDSQIAWANKMLRYLDDWKGLLIIRFVFFPLADTIGYAAGLAKISFRAYMFVTVPLLMAHAAVATAFSREFITNRTQYVYFILLMLMIPVALYLLRKPLRKIMPKRILGRIPFITPDEPNILSDK